MSMTGERQLWPHERLGKWTGSGFDPVVPQSVAADRVHVFCHGWAPRMRPAVEAADGTLLVWDQDAETADGARYDRWFAPLAEAILKLDPDAVILAYSWVDESATGGRSSEAIRSQLRTTINGQRLAVALDRVLAGTDAQVHLVGHSHGAKVVTVAATMMDRPPAHITIFDSPENVMPMLGGALNNLSSYLRMLPLGRGDGYTFVDNYPSRYGIRYGERTGLGAVVDCVLDPDAHPIEGQANPHSYPWTWYLHTAQNPDLGLGLAWSPLMPGSALPEHTQLQQATGGDEERNAWRLIYAPYVRTGGMAERLQTRLERQAERSLLLSTGDKTSTSGVFFRRQGDQLAVISMRWLDGDERSIVRIVVNRTERWRAVRGWSDSDEIKAKIPLGAMRAGPALYSIELSSEAPAAIAVGDATIRAIPVPYGTEFRTWLRPLSFAFMTLAAGLVIRAAWRLLRSKR